jgi:type I restriction enzyme M protein
VKVFVERELKAKRKRKNLFSVEFLEEQLGNNPLEDLFQKTKAITDRTVSSSLMRN